MESSSLNPFNDSLLAAVIKSITHCLDPLAPQLGLPTVINYMTAYLGQAL